MPTVRGSDFPVLTLLETTRKQRIQEYLVYIIEKIAETKEHIRQTKMDNLGHIDSDNNSDESAGQITGAIKLEDAVDKLDKMLKLTSGANGDPDDNTRYLVLGYHCYMLETFLSNSSNQNKLAAVTLCLNNLEQKKYPDIDRLIGFTLLGLLLGAVLGCGIGALAGAGLGLVIGLILGSAATGAAIGASKGYSSIYKQHGLGKAIRRDAATALKDVIDSAIIEENGAAPSAS